MADGLEPWFADPQLELAFFRPLSSLLWSFDVSLFGDWAPGYLLHSGLWYVALSGLVALLYQQLLPGFTGGLASGLFVVLGLQQQAVAWFSARNALVTAFFGLIGLLAHLAWREQGRRLGLPLSVFALILALAAGEAALGSIALILAYEIARSDQPPLRRLRAATPALGASLACLIVYVAMGYGTHASGAYINPLQEPWIFLRALPVRLSASLGVLFAGAPADLWFFAPGRT